MQTIKFDEIDESIIETRNEEQASISVLLDTIMRLMQEINKKDVSSHKWLFIKLREHHPDIPEGAVITIDQKRKLIIVTKDKPVDDDE